MTTEHFRQFIADNLDHLLAGRKSSQDLLPHGLLLHLFNELLDNLEMNIGLQQRHANFAQRLFHVGGRQFSFAAQVFENPLQLVAQIVEHDSLVNVGWKPGRA